MASGPRQMYAFIHRVTHIRREKLSTTSTARYPSGYCSRHQSAVTHRSAKLSLEGKIGRKFFHPFKGENIHLPKVENVAPIHQLLKSPKRQLISGVKSPPFPHRNNKLSHSIIANASTDQKSDQYWSASEPVLLTLSYQYCSHE